LRHSLPGSNFLADAVAHRNIRMSWFNVKWRVATQDSMAEGEGFVLLTHVENAQRIEKQSRTKRMGRTNGGIATRITLPSWGSLYSS
jgi:hypothetical protein